MLDAVNNVPGTRSLGVAMSELARTLQRDHASAHDTLHAVTTAAVQAVPGANNATISLVRDRTIVQRPADRPWRAAHSPERFRR